ncbi:MAG: hypothetical protein HLUCCO16_03320 [Phormidium sp. OSCR]|nr:MAG: hypothetical protein HLUCCO16_03320 [Phormidium sp. OSCR]
MLNPFATAICRGGVRAVKGGLVALKQEADPMAIALPQDVNTGVLIVQLSCIRT